MSAIRHFDVPHIVRFGRICDKECTTWMRFYRNATCFEVSIDQKDIAGTPFEEDWRQYLGPPPKPAPGAWARRWESFCDCVISQILPKLKELAPTGHRSWTTIEDYLSTPTYYLSTHRSEEDPEQKNVVAVVDSGPTPLPAFAYKPQPMTNLYIPADLPTFQVSELKLVQEEDLRQEPFRVLMPNGKEAVLAAAKGPMRRMPEEIMIHPSMTTISAHLSLHKLITSTDVLKESLVCFPEVLGIVTNSVTTSPEASTEDETEPALTTLLAGILLTYLPDARTLSDPSIVSIVAKSPNAHDIRQKWYATLLEAVRTLHARSTIVHGNINPWTILVCRASQDLGSSEDDSDNLRPYLKHCSYELSNNLFIDPVHRGTKEADLQGLESTFGDNGWLVHEIEKLNGDIDKDTQWKREKSA